MRRIVVIACAEVIIYVYYTRSKTHSVSQAAYGMRCMPLRVVTSSAVPRSVPEVAPDGLNSILR